MSDGAEADGGSVAVVLAGLRGLLADRVATAADAGGVIAGPGGESVPFAASWGLRGDRESDAVIAATLDELVEQLRAELHRLADAAELAHAAT